MIMSIWTQECLSTLEKKKYCGSKNSVLGISESKSICNPFPLYGNTEDNQFYQMAVYIYTHKNTQKKKGQNNTLKFPIQQSSKVLDNTRVTSSNSLTFSK